jgi:hypothetical protein
MTDWNELTEKCREAMSLAANNPGRYGGRYVARRDNRDGFFVMDDDDPEQIPDDVDVLAQVTPKAVYPIGRARNYLLSDGRVEFQN